MPPGKGKRPRKKGRTNIVNINATTINNEVIDKLLTECNDSNFYHQFVIYGATSYNKNFILKTILNHVYPASVIPIHFENGLLTSHFLAQNCQDFIQKLVADKFLVPLPDKPEQMFKILINSNYIAADKIDRVETDNVMEVLKTRYVKSTGMLNLKNFGEDGDLKEYTPLFQPALQRYVMQLASEFCLKILDLQDNDLRDVMNLYPLQSCPLETIILSNNLICSMIDLSVLKGFKNLKKLKLSGNPICAQYNSYNYVLDMKMLCPQLENLDDVDVLSPVFKKNFLCCPDAEDFACQFLEHFFQLYDLDDRRNLVDLYDKDAIFSVNSKIIPKQPRYLKVKLKPYGLNHQFAVKGISDIMKVYDELPRTNHDPHTFVCDVTLYTECYAALVVGGVFKDGRQIFIFTRHFLFIRKGEEFRIINEQLHVSNALNSQIDRSFRFPTRAQPLVPYFPEDYRKLEEGVHKITKLNREYCVKFLDYCRYDIKKTLDLFSELYLSNVIPQNAFDEDRGNDTLVNEPYCKRITEKAKEKYKSVTAKTVWDTLSKERMTNDSKQPPRTIDGIKKMYLSIKIPKLIENQVQTMTNENDPVNSVNTVPSASIPKENGQPSTSKLQSPTWPSKNSRKETQLRNDVPEKSRALCLQQIPEPGYQSFSDSQYGSFIVQAQAINSKETVSDSNSNNNTSSKTDSSQSADQPDSASKETLSSQLEDSLKQLAELKREIERLTSVKNELAGTSKSDRFHPYKENHLKNRPDQVNKATSDSDQNISLNGAANISNTSETFSFISILNQVNHATSNLNQKKTALNTPKNQVKPSNLNQKKTSLNVSNNISNTTKNKLNNAGNLNQKKPALNTSSNLSNTSKNEVNKATSNLNQKKTSLNTPTSLSNTSKDQVKPSNLNQKKTSLNVSTNISNTSKNQINNASNLNQKKPVLNTSSNLSNTSKNEVNNATSNLNQKKTSLNLSTNISNTTKNVVNNVSNLNQKKPALNTSSNLSNTSNNEVNNATSNLNQKKTSLNFSTNISNTTKNEVNSASNLNQKKPALNTSSNLSKTSNNEVNNATSNLNQKKTSLNTPTSLSNTSKDQLNNATSNLNQKKPALNTSSNLSNNSRNEVNNAASNLNQKKTALNTPTSLSNTSKDQVKPTNLNQKKTSLNVSTNISNTSKNQINNASNLNQKKPALNTSSNLSNTSKNEVNNATSNLNQKKTSLNVSTNVSNTSKNQVNNATSNVNQKKPALNTSSNLSNNSRNEVNNAASNLNQKKTSLNLSTNISNTTKNEVNSASNLNQKKPALNTSSNLSNTSNNEVNSATSNLNQKKTALNTPTNISSASKDQAKPSNLNQKKASLKVSTNISNTTKNEVNNATSNSNQKKPAMNTSKTQVNNTSGNLNQKNTSLCTPTNLAAKNQVNKTTATLNQKSPLLSTPTNISNATKNQGNKTTGNLNQSRPSLSTPNLSNSIKNQVNKTAGNSNQKRPALNSPNISDASKNQKNNLNQKKTAPSSTNNLSNATKNQLNYSTGNLNQKRPSLSTPNLTNTVKKQVNNTTGNLNQKKTSPNTPTKTPTSGPSRLTNKNNSSGNRNMPSGSNQKTNNNSGLNGTFKGSTNKRPVGTQRQMITENNVSNQKTNLAIAQLVTASEFPTGHGAFILEDGKIKLIGYEPPSKTQSVDKVAQTRSLNNSNTVKTPNVTQKRPFSALQADTGQSKPTDSRGPAKKPKCSPTADLISNGDGPITQPGLQTAPGPYTETTAPRQTKRRRTGHNMRVRRAIRRQKEERLLADTTWGDGPITQPGLQTAPGPYTETTAPRQTKRRRTGRVRRAIRRQKEERLLDGTTWIDSSDNVGKVAVSLVSVAATDEKRKNTPEMVKSTPSYENPYKKPKSNESSTSDVYIVIDDDENIPNPTENRLEILSQKNISKQLENTTDLIKNECKDKSGETENSPVEMTNKECQQKQEKILTSNKPNENKDTVCKENEKNSTVCNDKTSGNTNNTMISQNESIADPDVEIIMEKPEVINISDDDDDDDMNHGNTSVILLSSDDDEDISKTSALPVASTEAGNHEKCQDTPQVNNTVLRTKRQLTSKLTNVKKTTSGRRISKQSFLISQKLTILKNRIGRLLSAVAQKESLVSSHSAIKYKNRAKTVATLGSKVNMKKFANMIGQKAAQKRLGLAETTILPLDESRSKDPDTIAITDNVPEKSETASASKDISNEDNSIPKNVFKKETDTVTGAFTFSGEYINAANNASYTGKYKAENEENGSDLTGKSIEKDETIKTEIEEVNFQTLFENVDTEDTSNKIKSENISDIVEKSNSNDSDKEAYFTFSCGNDTEYINEADVAPYAEKFEAERSVLTEKNETIKTETDDINNFQTVSENIIATEYTSNKLNSENATEAFTISNSSSEIGPTESCEDKTDDIIYANNTYQNSTRKVAVTKNADGEDNSVNCETITTKIDNTFEDSNTVITTVSEHANTKIIACTSEPISTTDNHEINNHSNTVKDRQNISENKTIIANTLAGANSSNNEIDAPLATTMADLMVESVNTMEQNNDINKCDNLSAASENRPQSSNISELESENNAHDTLDHLTKKTSDGVEHENNTKNDKIVKCIIQSANIIQENQSEIKTINANILATTNNSNNETDATLDITMTDPLIALVENSDIDKCKDNMTADSENQSQISNITEHCKLESGALVSSDESKNENKESEMINGKTEAANNSNNENDATLDVTMAEPLGPLIESENTMEQNSDIGKCEDNLSAASENKLQISDISELESEILASADESKDKNNESLSNYIKNNENENLFKGGEMVNSESDTLDNSTKKTSDGVDHENNTKNYKIEKCIIQSANIIQETQSESKTIKANILATTNNSNNETYATLDITITDPLIALVENSDIDKCGDNMATDSENQSQISITEHCKLESGTLVSSDGSKNENKESEMINGKTEAANNSNNENDATLDITMAEPLGPLTESENTMTQNSAIDKCEDNMTEHSENQSQISNITEHCQLESGTLVISDESKNDNKESEMINGKTETANNSNNENDATLDITMAEPLGPLTESENTMTQNSDIDKCEDNMTEHSENQSQISNITEHCQLESGTLVSSDGSKNENKESEMINGKTETANNSNNENDATLDITMAEPLGPLTESENTMTQNSDIDKCEDNMTEDSENQSQISNITEHCKLESGTLVSSDESKNENKESEMSNGKTEAANNSNNKNDATLDIIMAESLGPLTESENTMTQNSAIDKCEDNMTEHSENQSQISNITEHCKLESGTLVSSDGSKNENKESEMSNGKTEAANNSNNENDATLDITMAEPLGPLAESENTMTQNSDIDKCEDNMTEDSENQSQISNITEHCKLESGTLVSSDESKNENKESEMSNGKTEAANNSNNENGATLDITMAEPLGPLTESENTMTQNSDIDKCEDNMTEDSENQSQISNITEHCKLESGTLVSSDGSKNENKESEMINGKTEAANNSNNENDATLDITMAERLGPLIESENTMTQNSDIDKCEDNMTEDSENQSQISNITEHYKLEAGTPLVISGESKNKKEESMCKDIKNSENNENSFKKSEMVNSEPETIGNITKKTSDNENNKDDKILNEDDSILAANMTNSLVPLVESENNTKQNSDIDKYGDNMTVDSENQSQISNITGLCTTDESKGVNIQSLCKNIKNSENNGNSVAQPEITKKTSDINSEKNSAKESNSDNTGIKNHEKLLENRTVNVNCENELESTSKCKNTSDANNADKNISECDSNSGCQEKLLGDSNKTVIIENDTEVKTINDTSEILIAIVKSDGEGTDKNTPECDTEEQISENTNKTINIESNRESENMRDAFATVSTADKNGSNCDNETDIIENADTN